MRKFEELFKDFIAFEKDLSGNKYKNYELSLEHKRVFDSLSSSYKTLYELFKKVNANPFLNNDEKSSLMADFIISFNNTFHEYKKSVHENIVIEIDKDIEYLTNLHQEKIKW